MKPVVLDAFVEEVASCVEKHRIETGAYRRWLWGDEGDLGVSEYGCADAANVLYTIGRFPSEPSERAAWVRTLQGMQHPDTGMYTDERHTGTRHRHHTMHTTAHCTAALELFDAKPLYRASALEKYTTKEGLYDLLENEVEWRRDPWGESHKGAGILPSLFNTGMVGLEWKNRYFDWMWEHSDPETGFFFCGEKPTGENAIPLYRFMGGGFHYMFNHEAEHRPYRYPEKIIDSCIELMAIAQTGKHAGFLHGCNFLDIDVVYSLTRAMRQSPHRFYEAKEALEEYAESYVKMLLSLDYEKDAGFNDLHCLFGAMCCLAELQSAVPGKLLTTRPLRLVLDRRPFI